MNPFFPGARSSLLPPVEVVGGKEELRSASKAQEAAEEVLRSSRRKCSRGVEAFRQRQGAREEELLAIGEALKVLGSSEALFGSPGHELLKGLHFLKKS